MQTVRPIDPNAVARTLQSAGIASPSYPRPQKASLGSILQSPPDLTRTSVRPDTAQGKSIWSDLPRVPQRDQLLGFGTVNRSVSPDPESQASGNKITPPPEVHSSSAPREVHSSSVHDDVHSSVGPELESKPADRVSDAKKRADYRVKFSILREAYPEMSIPDPRDDQGVDEIETMYKQYVKRIHIDTSVDQNKLYLLILWMVIEVIAARYIGLPMKGYTKYQFKYMNKYQMLLIELGERSYSSSLGEGWPVEIRLLGMAVFNAVLFVLVKFLSDKVGGGVMAEELTTMIDDFLTNNGNKGKDALRRAEEADSEHPPPPAAPESAEPPLGGFGNVLANLASIFANSGENKPAVAPEVKKPSTFGARRHKEGTTTEVS